MEDIQFLQNLSYPWHIVLLFTTLAVITLTWLRTHRKPVSNLPPGPKPWPIIGNLHQLKVPTHITLYQLSRTYGPLISLRLGSITTIVISTSEKAKDFLKTSDLAFASRPPSCFGEHMTYHHSDILFAPYGHYWREFRKFIVLKLLTVKRVESFTNVRRSELEIMLENIYKKSGQGTVAVDLSEAFAGLTTNIMWSIICGRNYAANELIEEISQVAGKFFIGDFIPWLGWLDIQGVKSKIRQLRLAYDSLAEEVIEGRLKNREKISEEANKPNDFLEDLLHAHEEKPSELTMQDVKALMLDMAVGGTETSSTAMEWSMSLILKHPQVLKKLQKEISDIVGKDVKVEEDHLKKMKYLQCVVREAMRMYPPVPLSFPHLSTENTRVCGYDVPKGSMLFLNLWAIGRDPLVWEDPDEFRPERFMGDESVDLNGFDMKSIPFSAGRRGCPGALMSIPVILLTLASLIHRFDWKVEDEIDMVEGVGIIMARNSHLFATPLLRN